MFLYLVGTVFAIMICETLSQFHFFYISKSTLWLRFAQCLKAIKLKKQDVFDSDSERAPLNFRLAKAFTGLHESLLEEPY